MGRIRVLLVAIAVAGLGVWAATFGPVRQTDLPLVGPPMENQEDVTLAYSGNEILLVWRDSRHLASGKLYAELMTPGSRPSPSSVGLAIRTGLFQDPNNPAAAHNGLRYLVAWDDDGPTGTKEIFGRFVHPDRTVGAPFQITSLTGDQTQPAVAADPATGQFLVAWVDGRGSPDRLYGKVLDLNGTDQGAAGGVLLSSTAVPYVPRATFDGTNYVLAWQDLRASPAQIYVTRVNTSGTVLDGTGDLLDGTTFVQTRPAVNASGGLSLVAWEETRDGGAGDLYGKRYQSGAPVSGTVLLGNTDGRQSDPFVSWDGARFWIAYQDTSPGQPQIRLARVTTAGTQLAGATVPTDGGQYFAPAIAGSNGSMGVFFHGGGGDPYDTDVFHVHLNSGSGGSGSIIFSSFPPPRVGIVAQGANGQYLGSAASDGTQYLVVWGDTRIPHAGMDVYGIRVDLDGVPKDSAAFLIAGGLNDQALPQVAYGGGVFLVTYADGEQEGNRYDLGAVRVSREGQVLDVPKRIIHDTSFNGLRRPAVSFNGENFLVAFHSGSEALRVTRVLPDGGVLDPTGLPILTTGGKGPRLAFDGTHHLLVFYRGDPLFSSASIHAARLQPDGGIIEPDGFELSVGPARRTPGSVAFDGRRHVVAWTEERSSNQSDVVVGYVTPGGTATAPVVAASQPVAFRHAAEVIYDGRRPLVTWMDLDPVAGQVHRDGLWLGDGGTVSSGPVRLETDIFYFPLLLASSLGASAGTGGSLLLTDRVMADNVYNANRLALRVVDEREPLGTACSSGSECVSGFCVDQVCCESACGEGVADCQACTAAGLCEATAAETTCRASQGACDPAERCDGLLGACPADAKLPSGTVCNAAAGACDLAEVCNGVDDACPADAIAPADYECRAASGGCDLAETCDGTSLLCPADQRAAADTVCRAASSACDVEEVCSGTSKECPADAFAPDESVCTDNGLCQAGVCESPRSYYGWACQGCSGAGGGPLALAGLLLAVVRRRLLRRGARSATRSPRGPGLLAVLVLIGLPTQARAAEETLSKLLVIGITPRAGVGSDQAETVASFVQTELTSLNAYRVSGTSEVAAVIGLERQKQLLGCSSEAEAESCMAEVAGAMNADRVLSGDLGILGDQLLLNLTLVDARTAKPISRTVVRAPASGSIDAVLDSIKPALYELVLKDTTRLGPSQLSYDRGFGGLVVGLRGEMDVARASPTPGVQVELSTRRFGAAVTALVQPNFGLRAEGRYYPVELGALRPYLGLGATAFIPAVGGRVAAGAAYRLSGFQLSLEVAYEHFLNPAPGYFGNAVVAGLGVGWQL